jgi:hypothetical protein
MRKYITLKNLGWLLTAIVTFMLGMGGLSKIAGSESMTTNFTAMNMVPYMALHTKNISLWGVGIVFCYVRGSCRSYRDVRRSWDICTYLLGGCRLVSTLFENIRQVILKQKF